jgi:NADPH:quinone reductase-like Zn-dependent oxidoreductase
MKAAIVVAAGQTPACRDFAEPAARPGESCIAVTAAAISPVTRSRAAGTHYSASRQFPFVVGIDGVGRLDGGQRVYFALPRAPFGGMAERTVVASPQCARIPDEVDDVTAAAIANPGMSSWAAYTERARLKPGETVLVNGATGIAGRLAVQIAKYLGATKVIATGRNAEALRSLQALGADVTIPLADNEKALEASFKEQFVEGVDVVVDYLWGKSAELLLIAVAKSHEGRGAIRFVQVGSASGSEIALPSAVLRAAPIELMGSGIGSLSIGRLINAAGDLLRAVVPGRFQIATKAVPLSKIEDVWDEDNVARTVLIPDT